MTYFSPTPTILIGSHNSQHMILRHDRVVSIVVCCFALYVTFWFAFYIVFFLVCTSHCVVYKVLLHQVKSSMGVGIELTPPLNEWVIDCHDT